MSVVWPPDSYRQPFPQIFDVVIYQAANSWIVATRTLCGRSVKDKQVARSCAHSSTTPRFLAGRDSGENLKYKNQEKGHGQRAVTSDE